MTYTLLNKEANAKWEWNGGRDGNSCESATAVTDIRDLLSVIPQFRLLVAHGYSDVLTPYGFSKFVVDHLPSALTARRVQLKRYRGAHMFYTSRASRAAFSQDVATFYVNASNSRRR